MLIDTSGLVCYFDEAEARHDDASTLVHAAPVLVTHSYVLAEFVAVCHSRRLSRRNALAFATYLLDNPDVEVVWVGESLHRVALALLQARVDRTYSLCDAVSFTLMGRRGVTDALTTDHHFEQEGFVRLLRP